MESASGSPRARTSHGTMGHERCRATMTNAFCLNSASGTRPDAPRHEEEASLAVARHLIRRAASTGKPLFIATRMATVGELDEAVRTAREAGCNGLILLKCMGVPQGVNRHRLSGHPGVMRRAGLDRRRPLRRHRSRVRPARSHCSIKAICAAVSGERGWRARFSIARHLRSRRSNASGAE